VPWVCLLSFDVADEFQGGGFAGRADGADRIGKASGLKAQATDFSGGKTGCARAKILALHNGFVSGDAFAAASLAARFTRGAREFAGVNFRLVRN
jgi:hypothetical protein